MDIENEIPLQSDIDFSRRYPIPFRVLFLSFTTLTGFAINLHTLSRLGIDTALVFDIRVEGSKHAPSSSPLVHPSTLYPPLYHLGLIGLVWTTLGWLLFSHLTQGDADGLVNFKGIPIFFILSVLVALVAPWNILYKHQRMRFLLALRKIVFGTLYSAVPFSDIIFADILTSFARVLGDAWVSGCLLVSSYEQDGGTCGRTYMLPIMTGLPYLFRFRQCVAEVVSGSSPTPRRSTMNAIKYATAFPVIIFSAMQRVVGDPFDDDAQSGADTSSYGIDRNTLFRLWVFSVLVNSLYSFYWDITNDWGLSLLTKEGWTKSSNAYAPVLLKTSTLSNNSASSSTISRARSRSFGNKNLTPPLASGSGSTQFPPPPSRPITPLTKEFDESVQKQRTTHTRAFSTARSPNTVYPFLRPIMLLPDPLLYYIAILINLVLRFTWSLKLSPHLHALNDVESGVFLIEVLEVFRRWMWVYLRIEWEAVRKGEGGVMYSSSNTHHSSGYSDEIVLTGLSVPHIHGSPSSEKGADEEAELGL